MRFLAQLSSFEDLKVLPEGKEGTFYLFACHVTWEQQEDPSAGWELIAAAQSTHAETRAQNVGDGFFGRGLPCRTGHADQGLAPELADCRRQRLQRCQRIVNAK